MFRRKNGVILLLMCLVVFSCTKEEDPTPPTLTFKTGTSGSHVFISKDTILTCETPFRLGIIAKATSEKNLASVTVERKFEVVDVTSILNQELSTPSYELDTLLKANSEAGTEDFVCTVTDKNDMSTSIHFTIVTEEADPMIKKYSQVKLGSYQSQTPNLISLSGGETYRTEITTDSTSLQQMADWVYFHGENYGHTFAAPSSEIASQIYPTTIAIWDTENKKTTKFHKAPSVSVSDFNAIENRSDLLVLFDNLAINWSSANPWFSENNSTPGEFDPKDVVAFRTSDGKVGLIKITLVDEGYTNGESKTTFDVIIENPQ